MEKKKAGQSLNLATSVNQLTLIPFHLGLHQYLLSSEVQTTPSSRDLVIFSHTCL